MNPARRRNLERLLNPRHVAIVGGEEAEIVVGECARIEYRGSLWLVNPRRDTIAGHQCFASVDDLPGPPDAAFVAVPRDAAIDIVARLRDIGAGGAVCYTAGFAEVGDEGAAREAALVAAAGDLALVGPNCYGVINYLDRVALWPFAHGGTSPGYGAAIITQSGMLSSDLTMSQRSLPFAFMISAGNQAVLTLEDFIEVLSARSEVRAIGLHIEGIRDLPRFCGAVNTALEAGIPVVALKTGTSRVGAQLTISHTGSLSGTDDLYQALFDRLGIIRVRTPAQMLETLKFLCVAGVPDGVRLAGLTCSGGSAAMLADYADEIGLEFPPPSPAVADRLAQLLPHTATVSNPLDYTTPIWGIPDRTRPVFGAMLEDSYAAAVLVQDYPLPGLDESRTSYINDAETFIAAARAADTPAAVCSTLPENIDRDTREMLIANGVAPMQGIRETLEVIAGCAWYGRHRARRDRFAPAAPTVFAADGAAAVVVDEWQGKKRLRAVGIGTPRGRAVGGDEAPHAAAAIGFPVAIKLLSERLPHKTEAGAVVLRLASEKDVASAVDRIRENVRCFDAAALSDRFLVEEMVAAPLAEMLVSIRAVPGFGFAMTLASGGVLTELVADAVTVLLPVEDSHIEEALAGLKVSRLLDGFRGSAPTDRAAIVATLRRLADYVCQHGGSIAEVEINPLFVLPDGVCAVDVLLREAPYKPE